jgi:ferrous iron transport protein A
MPHRPHRRYWSLTVAAVINASLAASLALTGLPKNADARVLQVTHQGELAQRLHDLGFIAGEAVRVVAHAIGGDPIAVRVGHSTFALRRVEAAGVLVQPDAQFDARRPE